MARIIALLATLIALNASAAKDEATLVVMITIMDSTDTAPADQEILVANCTIAGCEYTKLHIY